MCKQEDGVRASMKELHVITMEKHICSFVVGIHGACGCAATIVRLLCKYNVLVWGRIAKQHAMVIFHSLEQPNIPVDITNTGRCKQ